jgi:hypothetical protein
LPLPAAPRPVKSNTLYAAGPRRDARLLVGARAPACRATSFCLDERRPCLFWHMSCCDCRWPLQFASEIVNETVLHRFPGCRCWISPRPPLDKAREWPKKRAGPGRQCQTSAGLRQSRGSLAVLEWRRLTRFEQRIGAVVLKRDRTERSTGFHSMFGSATSAAISA